MSKLGDEQAFPAAWPSAAPHFGLTKREYYAGLAMQGMLSNPSLIDGGGSALLDWIGECATEMADTLIQHLEKEAP